MTETDLYPIEDMTVQEAPVADLYAEKPPISTVLPAPVLQNRALKYSIALNQNAQDIHQALLAGGEEHLRDQAVSDDVSRQVEIAQAITQDYVFNGGDDPEMAKALATVRPPDKDTILEKGFAGNLMDNLLASAMKNNAALEKEVTETPDLAMQGQQAMIDLIARQEYMRTLAENTDAATSAINPLSKVNYYAAQAVIPFFDWIGHGTSNLLTGSALREQIMEINELPLEEAKLKAKTLVEETWKFNPILGAEVANALVSYSYDQENVNSALSILGVAGTVSGSKLLQGFLKGVSKGVLKSSTSIPQVLSSAGQPIQAAQSVVKAEKIADTAVNESARAKTGMSDLTSSMPHWLDPDYLTHGAPQHYKGWVERIRRVWAEELAKLNILMRRPMGVSTVSPEMEDTLLEMVATSLKERFRTFSDSILQVRKYAAETNSARIGHVEASLGVPQMPKSTITEKFDLRIEESSGSGTALPHATYKDFKDWAKTSGMSDADIAKGTGIKNEKDFLKLREEEITKYVEEPVQPLVREVYKEGGSPTASNAFGPGLRGVWYVDKNGIKSFKKLHKSDPIGMISLAKGQIASVKIGGKTFFGDQHYDGVNEAIKEFGRNSPEIKEFEKNPDSAFSWVDSTVDLGIDEKTYKIEFDLGASTKNNLKFDTEDSAVFSAENIYQLKSGTYTPVQEADGWVIRVAKDINEREDGVLDNYKSPYDSSKSSNRTLAWWDAIRSGFDVIRGNPRDIVSEAVATQRSAALHGQAGFHELMMELSKPIRELKKPEALRKLLEANRDDLSDPNNLDSRGRWYKNLEEFDTAFFHNNSRMPTEQEVEAYFNFVRMHEVDWLLKNLSIVRALSRQGVENVIAKIDGADVSFNGKRVDALPPAERGVKVLFVDANGKSKITTLTDKLKIDVEDLQKTSNYSVFQVADPLRKTVNGKDTVVFVVSKDSQTGPLKFDQMPYRQGGHSAYEDPWKIVQSQFEGGMFSKDQLAYFAKDNISGAKILDVLNKARDLYSKGDIQGLKDHLSKTIPIDVDDFIKGFKSGRFDPKVPFMLVKSGSESVDSEAFGQLYKNTPKFKDSTYNLDKSTDQVFRGERDRVVKGIYEKPSGWEVTDATQVDPIMTQLKELNRLTRSKFYDPLLMKVAESAIEEFGTGAGIAQRRLFKKPGTNDTLTSQELRRNPIYWFHHADISKDATPLERMTIQNIRGSHRRLLGHPGTIERQINTFLGRYYEPILKKFGMDKIPAGKEIPFISNGIDFMRATATYAKFGFFNVHQLMVQGMGVSVMMSVMPHRAVGASMASVMMRVLNMTENASVISHGAEVIAKLKIPGGFKTAEQVQESYNWLKRTNFDLIGSSGSVSDIMTEPGVHTNLKTGRRMLDKSLYFFKKGEEFVNTNAWNGAYLEYISKNKGKAGKLTEADAQKILVRAKTFSGGMQRDMNHHWQSGVGNLTTQFYGYYAQMVDLAVGRQLSGWEKARFLVGTSLLFGTNYGGSIAYALQEGDINAVLEQFNLVNGDDLRTYAMKNGVDVNAGMLGVIANGLPQQVFSALVGEEINFADRYGSQGLGVTVQGFKRTMDQYDNDILGAFVAMTGASGNIVESIISDMVPMVGELVNPEGMNMDVMGGHIKALASNVTTGKTLIDLHDALEEGTYYSSNGALLSNDISNFEAWVYVTTGMHPQQIADDFKLGNVNKDASDETKDNNKEALPLMREYLKIYKEEGSTERTQDLAKRIDIILRRGKKNPLEIRRNKIRLMKDAYEPIGKHIYETYIKGGRTYGEEGDRRELTK